MRLRHIVDGLLWVGQFNPKSFQALRVKGMDYKVSISSGLWLLLCNFDLSGCRVSLLDGDFDWYWKCSSATGLVFEPMESHTIGVSTWPNGWWTIGNHFMTLWIIWLSLHHVSTLHVSTHENQVSTHEVSTHEVSTHQCVDTWSVDTWCRDNHIAQWVMKWCSIVHQPLGQVENPMVCDPIGWTLSR